MLQTTMSNQATIQPICKKPFTPRSYHVLVVQCSERTSLITNQLIGHYINIHTGLVEHTEIFQTKQFYHLYFYPTKYFTGFAYIQRYKGWGEFSCSCSENLKSGYCQHIEELEGVHTSPEMLGV